MKIYGFYNNDIVELEVEDRGLYYEAKTRHPAFYHALKFSKEHCFTSKKELLERVVEDLTGELKNYKSITRQLTVLLKAMKQRVEVEE